MFVIFCEAALLKQIADWQYFYFSSNWWWLKPGQHL